MLTELLWKFDAYNAVAEIINSNFKYFSPHSAWLEIRKSFYLYICCRKSNQECNVSCSCQWKDVNEDLRWEHFESSLFTFLLIQNEICRNVTISVFMPPGQNRILCQRFKTKSNSEALERVFCVNKLENLPQFLFSNEFYSERESQMLPWKMISLKF